MCEDPVVEKLVVDTVSGYGNITEIIQFCRLLKYTGRGGGAIDAIAAIGGSSIKNTRRDFVSLCMGLYGCTLHPVNVAIRLLNAEGFAEPRQCTILLPFDCMKSMYKMSPKQFKYSFLGQDRPAELLQYWDNLQEGYPHHVCKWEPWKRACTIPLYQHVDGVEIYNEITYSVVSVSSALARNISSFDQQMAVLIFPEADACRETYLDLAALTRISGEFQK